MLKIYFKKDIGGGGGYIAALDETTGLGVAYTPNDIPLPGDYITPDWDRDTAAYAAAAAAYITGWEELPEGGAPIVRDDVDLDDTIAEAEAEDLDIDDVQRAVQYPDAWTSDQVARLDVDSMQVSVVCRKNGVLVDSGEYAMVGRSGAEEYARHWKQALLWQYIPHGHDWDMYDALGRRTDDFRAAEKAVDRETGDVYHDFQVDMAVLGDEDELFEIPVSARIQGRDY